MIAGPDGAAWLTDGGQNAIARVNWPAREVRLFPLPAGTPYANLNTCAFDGDGDLWFTGQSGYVGKVALHTGAVSVKASPRQDARRVWSDSLGRIWVPEWSSGNLSMHDPALGSGAASWLTWKAPGADPHVYAVYVDDQDIVWASEWSNNGLLRFDPVSEKFSVITLPRPRAGIRQILGRRGEVWLPESGTEFIAVVRTG